MSYRTRRERANQDDFREREFPSRTQKRQPARYPDSIENDEDKFTNNGRSYNSRNFSQSNNETTRYNPTEENRRAVRVPETKIPVAKRVRVPNTRTEEEDRVTPVRERFRARHQEETNKRNDFQRNKINDSKRVTFYRNGDKHFKGRTLFITRQRYRSYESLLEELSRLIPLPYGVRNVFTSVGRLINSINELEDGGFYICSYGDQLIRNVDYEKNAKILSKNEKELPEGMQNIAISAPSDSSSTSSSSRSKNLHTKPKIITIINQERGLKSKILLNRKTAKNYEDILCDISEMMKLQGEHVQELVSENGRKVGGLSEMFYGGEVYNAVIAADLLSSKRNLSNPSSHSSNGLERLSPASDRQKRASRKKQRRDINAHEEGVAIKVKGKKLVFYPPSKRNKLVADEDELTSAPSSSPQLNWVYGYQGKDTHHNLHVLPSGEILYIVSRIVVIYNRKTNTQRHYIGHADDIKCMAVHPNQWYIATGQVSGLSLDHNELSHIRIWDSETLLTLNVLQLDDYSLNIISMAFSVEDNGDILAGIDSSGDNFRLNIWEWKDSKCFLQSKEFSSPVSVVMFDPEDNKTIISCGREHIYFWRWHNGKLERKNGLFENNPFPQYVTCMDFANNGDLFTGDSNGSITAWSKVSKKVKFMVRNAHEKSILCLSILESGLLLTAGGVDGKICAWDSTKYFSVPLHEIQLPELTGISALEPLNSGDGNDVTLILGTTTNSILEGSLTGPTTTIVKGHKFDVPSFAVHPSRDIFVTTSLDKTATLWSAVNKEILWTSDVEFAIRVAAFYTTGSVIAFGTNQGRWIVLNAESGAHQASFQDGTEPIADLEYSPDGEHIAVGSKDGNIYIHAVYDDGMTYRRVGCCSGHTNPVMFLDWSADGCFVQSMSTEYDIITWEIGGFERENSQNVIRDTEWNTRNVVLGYDVVGVWRSTPTEGNLVTSSDLAWSHNLIAIGDELGYIRVFNYPCYYDESQYHQVRAHSSTVLRVMFLSSDKYLLSTAGHDCALLQWTMEGKMKPQAKSAPQIKEVLSNSDEHTDQDAHDSEQVQSLPEDEKPTRLTVKAHNHDRVDYSDSGEYMGSDDYSNEENNLSKERQGQQRRRGRHDKTRPRRSFEQDMYQERDETSDERKKKILRHGRATKRYEQDDDDDSTDDYTYDEDDMADMRHHRKSNYKPRGHINDDVTEKRQIRTYEPRGAGYDDKMIDKGQTRKTNNSYKARGYAKRRSPDHESKKADSNSKLYIQNRDDHRYSKRAQLRKRGFESRF